MLKKINISYYFDYLILIFFSFFVNFYYSSKGVLPQDTFAYYDSAFRILNGAVPFKDYWTVSGPFIDYLQAIIFYIFGISWKTYIVNGSLINSLISVIFFYVIRNFGQSRPYSLFYSLCFSVLANPSMGTPFPDHYSAFFSLIGFFFFLLALKKEKKIFWYLLPICFFLGFFSKQSPSSYILLVLLISTLIYIFNSKNFFFLKYYLISSISCLLFLFIFFYLNKVNLQQFINQYFLFPQTIAAERIYNYQITFNSLFLQFKFIYFYLIFLVFVLLTTYKKIIFNNDHKFLYSLNVIFISIVLIFHQIVTKNFIFIFFLIPMLASLIQLNLNNIIKFKKIIIIILISSTFLLTLKYHFRFNEERKMLNLENKNLGNSIDAKFIHPSLKGLKWVTNDYFNNSNVEITLIKESMSIIDQDKSRKMLLTGYLFMSSVINENLNNPSRWPSIKDASNPNRDNQYYSIYKKFVKDLIFLKRIETLYSTKDNQDDIFVEIFDKNCRKTKVINDFLTKHDIKNCIK